MKLNFQNLFFMKRFAQADRINVLVLISIWFFMLILINPLGDFPMIDDWTYGLAVKSLLEKGDFRFPAYVSANVFAQVFWGALFCLPFGFSFTALRFSTLTLGLVGVLITYVLLREVNANSKMSLIGALLVALNPIYFALSNTFMTDVPFFAFFCLSLYFLIRGFKRDSNIEITIGIGVSYVALLIRQFGLIIPLAFGSAYLVKKGINFQNIIKAFIPTVLGFSIQIFYSKWLHITGRIPRIQNPQLTSLVENISNFNHISGNTRDILIYMGAFIFPLLIIILLNNFKNIASQVKKRLIIFGLLAFWASVIGYLLLKNRIMPLLCCHMDFGFIFGPLSQLQQPSVPLLGALNYGNLLLLKSPTISPAIKIYWIFMTSIGVFCIPLLLYCLWLAFAQIFRINKASKYLSALVISAIFVYLSLIIISDAMDRYLLPLLPLFMITTLVASKDINKLNVASNITFLVLAGMLIYGGFTVGATHDYLSRDRTIWQAANNLMQEAHVLPNQIDGGYEFNGWLKSDNNYITVDGQSFDEHWQNDNADYIISSGPLSGYEEVKRYPFRRWLSFQEGNIVVLRKTTK